MKYTVKCSCGHEIVVNLCGKGSEREAKIKWYETKAFCPECYKAKKESERNVAVDGFNLPELEGSEKQIAWAEKIRSDFIAGAKSYVLKYANATAEQKEQAKKILSSDTDPFSNVVYKKAVAAIEETSAKWWIDNMDY